MLRRLPRPLPFLILLLLLVVAGCATGVKKQVTLVPDAKAHAIAVYPFGFRWPEPAYRSFELTERLIQGGISEAGQKTGFIGPGEFRIYRTEDDHVWAATDLIAELPGMELKPEDLLVLRPWAEKLVESSSQQASSASGKAVRASVTEELTYRGHVEVLHPASGTRVADLTGEVKVDPFATHDDDSDPAPELTTLMLGLVHEALTTVDPMLAPPTAPHVLTLTLLFNPDAALDYQDSGRPALRAELVKKDPVEGELLRMARIRYANPGLTDAEAGKLSRLPGGLVVRQSSGRFQALDVITQVNGQPALPQTLARARFSKNPVQVRVKKADGQWGDYLLF